MEGKDWVILLCVVMSDKQKVDIAVCTRGHENCQAWLIYTSAHAVSRRSNQIVAGNRYPTDQ